MRDIMFCEAGILHPVTDGISRSFPRGEWVLDGRGSLPLNAMSNREAIPGMRAVRLNNVLSFPAAQ